MRTITRLRALGSASAAFAAVTILPQSVRAAQFTYKYGHDQGVDNPLNVRAIQMANDIKAQSNGRLIIQIYANSQLGSDPAMIQQVREGALEISCQSGAVLSTLVPAAGVQAVPYAFKTDHDATLAQYGEIGAYVRKEINAKIGVRVFPVALPGGFRQITSGTHPIRNADDLAGFKLRVPPGQIYFDTYKALGAQIVSLSLGEVYTALQTHVVDGQDNPYVIIETQKIYEVQKYLSIMDSIWSGQLIYIGAEAWTKLPPDLQTILDRNVKIYAERQQRDNTQFNDALVGKLQRQGLTFNTADRESFRSRLGPLYAKVKAMYGPTLWALLEKTSGKLG